MSDLAIAYEIERMLTMFNEEQLVKLHTKLYEECVDLAEQFIEAESSFCIDVVKERYTVKKSLLNKVKSIRKIH